MEDLPTVEDLNERIQQAEVRGDATSLITLVLQRQELLDSQRVVEEPEPVDPECVTCGGSGLDSGKPCWCTV